MSVHTTFHLFLSYARKDNLSPLNSDEEGWVTAFEREIKERHKRYSGRDLKIFFDAESIIEGEDWKRRLGEGLRSSRLFLAFLTPNYITSKNCLWEWEEYLRREHSTARGDDGITPIYFVTPADLRIGEDQVLAAWLAEMEKKYPWFKASAQQVTAAAEQLAKPFAKDLTRRNKTLNCELQSWFANGPEILKHLDAEAASLDLKNTPRDPSTDLRTLAERLAGLDRRIAQRLDRIALADLAPGNIARSHEHFVGRHRELSELHTILLTGGAQRGGRGSGGRGMIAAVHSPGGLGKTALVRQYAHAYAEFYAVGGTWEIPCEGVSTLGAALLKLADSQEFQDAALWKRNPDKPGAAEFITEPLELTDAQKADYNLAAGAVLAYLRRLTNARVAVLRAELMAHPDRHSPEAELSVGEQPRALLVLDNLDMPELLDSGQIALLPAEDWLEIIVTTRLDPESFGGSDRTFAHVEVDVLPETDALHLLRDFQPDHAFPNDEEEAAAREIVRALGGYTLAVELVAAYLGDRVKQGYTALALLAELRKEGLAWVDSFADKPYVDKVIRHGEDSDNRRNKTMEEIAKAAAEKKRQNRVATLVCWSMAQLSPEARTALEFASLLKPDAIPMPWLRDLTCQRHPNVGAASLADDNCWPALWRELHGLRLLQPAGPIEMDGKKFPKLPDTVRIHRLVAIHVANADKEANRKWSAIEGFIEALGHAFQQQVGQGEHAALLIQHTWLRDQLDYLTGAAENRVCSRAPTPVLLRVARVAADFEGIHGSLAHAVAMNERILTATEMLHATDSQSDDLARDISGCLEWLGTFLPIRGQVGDGELALRYFRRCLKIREDLLAVNPASFHAARDVSLSLGKLAHFLSDRSHGEGAAQVLEYYKRSLKILDDLHAANPTSDLVARDISVLLNKLVVFLFIRDKAGDAEQALRYAERSLKLSEDLLADNPFSTQAARDVSAAMDKLAELLEKRGRAEDAERALGYYKYSLKVRQDILAADGSSTQAARDVSLGLSKLADFLSKRGQAEEAPQALAYYQRSLKMSEELFAANPANGNAARDVSNSLQRLADFLSSQGRMRDAEQVPWYYKRSLKIREELLTANPSSGQAARDVSISLDRLADYLSDRGQAGDLEQALSYYKRNLNLCENLLVANPSNALPAREVAVSLAKLADCLSSRGQAGDTEQAVGHYQRSVKLSMSLLAANPDNGLVAQDLSISLGKLADLLAIRSQAGDAELALGYYQQRLKLLEKLMEANPGSEEAGRAVFLSLERLGDFLASRGKHGDAEQALSLQVRSLEMVLKLRELHPQSYLHQHSAAVSFINTYRRAQAVGNEELADQCLTGCFSVLDPLVRAGIQLDPSMRDIHTQLKPMFKQP